MPRHQLLLLLLPQRHGCGWGCQPHHLEHSTAQAGREVMARAKSGGGML